MRYEPRTPVKKLIVEDSKEEIEDKNEVKEMIEAEKLPKEGGQSRAKASSRLGMRIYPPALILKITKEGKDLYKYHGRRETTRLLIEKYPVASLNRRTVDRWVFDMTQEKLNEIEKLTKRKSGKVRLSANIKAMEDSRTVT